MAIPIPPPLAEALDAAGQLCLLDHFVELTEPHASRFLAELQSVDWQQVRRLIEAARTVSTANAVTARELALRAEPPQNLTRLPQTSEQRELWQEARDLGEASLCAGRVGVIVVAGGQGTRLGSTLPKGMLPIGPLSGKPLFEWFCEQLLTRRERSGQPIPYAVMTSAATHAETAAFFEEHGCFGLPPEDVPLFQQGHLPAIDLESGVALLSSPGHLALSPDGHGGMLAALAKANILQQWADRGIETLAYHQVDNPSTIVADPAFIGWHLLHRADVSVKVVAKKSATERMGVVVSVDGVTRIIEYSDLPDDAAARVDARGRLKLWAGSTAMHAFQREFLERALVSDEALPFHVVRKVVPFWKPDVGVVTPATPNAFKFERFIFDVLPWAQTVAVVEADRASEFNPVKNREGDDSPETAKAALIRQHQAWLRAAGAVVEDDIAVEISPRVAVEPGDLLGQIPAGTVINQPLYLTAAALQAWRSA